MWAALLGLSKYRSAMDVRLEKTSKKVDHKDSFALRFGSFAESFIADEYALLTGESVVEHTHGLVHAEYSFCVGHIALCWRKRSYHSLLRMAP